MATLDRFAAWLGARYAELNAAFFRLSVNTRIMLVIAVAFLVILWAFRDDARREREGR